MAIRSILILSLLMLVACGSDDPTGPVDTNLHSAYFPIGDTLRWVYEHTTDAAPTVDTVVFTLTKTADSFDSKVLYEYSQFGVANYSLFVDHDTVFSLQYVAGSDPLPRVFWKPLFSQGDEWDMVGQTYTGPIITFTINNELLDLSAEVNAGGIDYRRCLEVQGRYFYFEIAHSYEAYYARGIGLVYITGSWWNAVEVQEVVAYEYRLLEFTQQ
ncbi:MAG: hypothetical protein JSW34_03825 [Candidatus Zixiibacteriota bacterium]|nr:MAG: hypothetical protein JSW34_03825 [candidate division Zixibacteria bacterium]